MVAVTNQQRSSFFHSGQIQQIVRQQIDQLRLSGDEMTHALYVWIRRLLQQHTYIKTQG